MQLNLPPSPAAPGKAPVSHEPRYAGNTSDSSRATQQPPEANEVLTDSSNAVAEELAAQSAANRGGIPDSQVVYTSHPILNLTVGPFRFENGTLKLPDASIDMPQDKQVDSFAALLKTLPLIEQHRIRLLDVGKVDQIVRDRQSIATRQFDSSVGREALERLHANTPTTGTEDLVAAGATRGFSEAGQGDENEPTVVNPIGDLNPNPGAPKEPAPAAAPTGVDNA